MNILPITVCLTACWLPAQTLTLPAGSSQALTTDVERDATGALAQAASSLANELLGNKVLFDRPDGDQLWARGRNWKATFGTDDWTFIPYFGSTAPRNFPIALEIHQVSVGGVALNVHTHTQVHRGQSVRIDHGCVVEQLDMAVDAIEQSFVFHELPANRGEIVVDVAFTTDLEMHSTSRGITFSNQYGAASYEKAIAIDASGARLPLTIERHDGHARMVIPEDFVARAKLPLVLDPVISSRTLSFSPASILFLDTATLQAPDQTLMVWQQPYSATDLDCYAVAYSRDLTQAIFAPVAIDFTASSWTKPRVASNAFSRKYLVVGEQNAAGGLTDVVGRMVNDAGVLQPRFDIQPAIPIALPGYGGASDPDVGGDPYLSAQAYFTVVFTMRNLVGTNDVYFRQVDQSGNLLGTNKTTISAGLTNEITPSISESNRTSTWRVAFVKTNFTSSIIVGVHIDWNGVISNPGYTIANSTEALRRPSCSTTATLSDGTTELGLVTFEREQVFGTTVLDIDCVVIDQLGTVRATLDFSATMASPSNNHRKPECDSDGTRFAMTFHEVFGSYETVYATTLAFDEALGALRIEEAPVVIRPLSLANADNRTPIASYLSGGNQVSTSYSVAALDVGLATLFEYGGHTAGPFFLVRPTECGNLPITAEGSPALGNTVTITAQSPLPTGTLFGFPGNLNLSFIGCPCTVGVDQSIVSANPLIWTVPNNTAFVGVELSVQGWAVSGGNCLSLLDLSDTIDFEVR